MSNAVDSRSEADPPECKGLAFTTYMCTSRNNYSHISTTLHYIEKDFNQKNFDMGCASFKESHASAAISKELENVIEEISGLLPDAARVAVHDSGANIEAAMPKSSQITNSQININHQLNLIVSKAVGSKKTPTIAQAFESFKTLLTHVNHSPLDLETIHLHYKEIGVSYVKLITPVATR